MFFIGIFGIDNKSKIISTSQNIICPSCGAYGRYDVIKSYHYFHAFFIPLFKWNKRYFIQTHCCSRLCSLDKDLGLRIENGERVEIEDKHVHCNGPHANGSFCPRCAAQVDPAFKYCPHCGSRIT